jgi:hypothetical protein
MAILEVTEHYFAMVAATCRDHWNGKRELAWFAATAGVVVGVLHQDPTTGVWGYAICQKNDGGFDCVKTVTDIDKADTARLLLVANMRSRS